MRYKAYCVTRARWVNPAERTALVMEAASAADLVQVQWKKAGYGAEAIEDDIKRQRTPAGNRHRHHETLRWQAIVAPAVGINTGHGLGDDGDNMMGDRDNRSLWLAIGLITLAVMVFAWRSLFTVTREKPAERHGDDGYAGGVGTGVASALPMSGSTCGRSGSRWKRGTSITKPAR